MCFDVIARSKCYSLFPILSSLIEPSLRSFRISLSNGLFSSVGIGQLGKVFFPQNRTWEFPTSYGSIHYSLVLYQNFQNIIELEMIHWEFILTKGPKKVNDMSFWFHFQSIQWSGSIFSPTLKKMKYRKRYTSDWLSKSKSFCKVTISVPYRIFGEYSLSTSHL